MIPIPIFAYKWIAIGLAMMLIAAWGGLGWYGKATAERELAAYQLAAARVIADRLAENQRLSEAQAKTAAAISDAYQKGKADVAKSFQPALADLQFLRGLHCPGGVCQRAPTDPGTVPGPADPAGGPDAAACTVEPGRIVEAAAGVVEDLAACADTRGQLIALQAWVAEVCSK